MPFFSMERVVKQRFLTWSPQIHLPESVLVLRSQHLFFPLRNFINDRDQRMADCPGGDEIKTLPLIACSLQLAACNLEACFALPSWGGRMSASPPFSTVWLE